jgi:hypothetical protein
LRCCRVVVQARVHEIVKPMVGKEVLPNLGEGFLGISAIQRRKELPRDSNISDVLRDGWFEPHAIHFADPVEESRVVECNTLFNLDLRLILVSKVAGVVL